MTLARASGQLAILEPRRGVLAELDLARIRVVPLATGDVRLDVGQRDLSIGPARVRVLSAPELPRVFGSR